MKRFALCLIGLLCLAGMASAQYKVTESSDRKMPSWVSGIQPGYLSVSATGTTLEEARDGALLKLKSDISESVAVRIIATTDLQSSSFEINGAYSYQQKLESDVKSKTARLPFLKEISLSKVEKYYWEERYYKNTRQVEYFYSILYPFTDRELKVLVAEYEEQERKLNERLAQFETMLDQMTSIEDITRSIADLKAFQSEFMDEDPRNEKVAFLIQEYNHLFDAITISAVQTQKGVVAAVLMLQDREISTRQRPTLKSNCAAKLTSSFEGNTILIKYDDFPCYEEDDNYIDIRFATGGSRTIYERIYIKQNLHISLTGIVSDQAGNPVPYAKITLIPSGKQTVTGKNGVYQFNDLNPANYEVQAMKTHYQTVSNFVYVSGKETVRCDLATQQVGSTQLPSQPSQPEAPIPTVPQPQVQPQNQPNPAYVVRNGLFIYFRFNNSSADELESGINAQLVNGARYSNESVDGTQSLQLNAANESFISIPKTLFFKPFNNYSVSFWVLGASDGHYFSARGNSTDTPRLIMENGKFRVLKRYKNEGSAFTHGEIPYQWVHVAISCSPNEENNGYILSLYINGELTDAISGWVKPFDHGTKYIFGGPYTDDNESAVSMNIDNLRIYTRSLSAEEVKLIYQAEGGR